MIRSDDRREHIDEFMVSFSRVWLVPLGICKSVSSSSSCAMECPVRRCRRYKRDWRPSPCKDCSPMTVAYNCWQECSEPYLYFEPLAQTKWFNRILAPMVPLHDVGLTKIFSQLHLHMHGRACCLQTPHTTWLITVPSVAAMHCSVRMMENGH